MNDLFYTERQLKVFSEDLLKTFVNYGFEILDEPYIDYALLGFRATYIRRYMLHKPRLFCEDGILTTVVHVVGLPFGKQSQRMVILSAPRDLQNQPVSDTLRLRIHFNDDGSYHVVHSEQFGSTHQQNSAQASTNNQQYQFESNQNNSGCGNLVTPQFSSLNISKAIERNKSNHTELSKSSLLLSSLDANQESAYCLSESNNNQQLFNGLASYVSHIIEIISPGLIELPIEMKLEILKKLSVDSIIKMSKINKEFHLLIFVYGESLWKHLCYRDFRVKSLNRMIYRSWMELYRDLYMAHQIEIIRKERALPGLPERPALPPVPYRLQIEWLPEVLALPFL